MRHSILSIILVSSLIFTLNQCTSSSSKDVDEAKAKVDEANEKLDRANKEYQQEVEEYREETQVALRANEELIAKLREVKASNDKKAQLEREAKIAELERKNTELSAKLSEYKADSKAGWNNFKKEFKHDMNELGKAFKELGSDDVKDK